MLVAALSLLNGDESRLLSLLQFCISRQFSSIASLVICTISWYLPGVCIPPPSATQTRPRIESGTPFRNRRISILLDDGALRILRCTNGSFLALIFGAANDDDDFLD